MGENMKSTYKVLLGFVAGAACATVIAGTYYGKAMGPEEFRDRLHFVATELTTLGGQVVFAHKGIVWINASAVDACMKPPPKPNEVGPRTLVIGSQAALEYANGLLSGNTEIIRLTDKCHPMGD
jgi:hypothetical protein